jgi:hypothetical protein
MGSRRGWWTTATCSSGRSPSSARPKPYSEFDPFAIYNYSYCETASVPTGRIPSFDADLRCLLMNLVTVNLLGSCSSLILCYPCTILMAIYVEWCRYLLSLRESPVLAFLGVGGKAQARYLWRYDQIIEGTL